MNVTPFVEGLHRPEVRAGLVIAFMVFVLSEIPVLRSPLYVLSLFGVYVHELWHGFAAILTGGSFKKFVIRPQLTGAANAPDGVQWIVGSAGYVGTPLTGCLLLVAAASDVPARRVLLLLGISLGILCLLFVRNFFGMLAGLVLAVAFVIASQQLHEFWQMVGLWFLGLQLILDSVKDLLRLLDPAADQKGETDPYKVGKLTGIDPFLWLVLWLLVISVALLYAINRAYQVPLPWGS